MVLCGSRFNDSYKLLPTRARLQQLESVKVPEWVPRGGPLAETAFRLAGTIKVNYYCPILLIKMAMVVSVNAGTTVTRSRFPDPRRSCW